MQAIEIHLFGKIWWRLSPTLTVSSPISAIGGWSIASPLAIDRQTPFAPRRLLAQSDGTVLFDSDCLVLVADDNSNVVQDNTEITRSLPQYLNALRVASGQPELPRSILMFTGIRRIDKLNAPNIPDRSPKSRVRKYIVESALTLNHLTDASDAVINDTVPVHSELANDAAESAIRSNYRSAIISAASAIESCAGSVLDREYNRLLSQSSQSSAHRCVTIQVNKQESVNKDPVFIALRTGTGDGGSRFLPLLHECPLYLLGHSLKLDEPDMYRQAHALYRTRNSLAHTGTTDIQKSGLLDVDYQGAMTALTVANNILDWFGEKGTSIPNNDMIECSG